MHPFRSGPLALVLCVLMSALLRAGVSDTEQLYLSGHDRADAIAWDFRCSEGPKAGQWSSIPVPSNWEMEGHGTFAYMKDPQKAVGDYRRRFSVPESFRSRRVYLVFEGAMTDTLVKVNGVQAGPVHRGGFYRFRYDVSSLLKPGAENLLEVTVAEESSNESINRAERQGDYWKFGGIYRPVRLEALPTEHIDRVAVDAKADGSLLVDCFLGGEGKADRVEAQVADTEGKVLGATLASAVSPGKTRLNGKIPGVLAWNAEKPVLYHLEVRLFQGSQLLHVVRERIGFRTFEVRRGEGLFLNGKRLLLKGANRHSFNADTGRCLSEADHRRDIALMREMNMNAVRMSHYPPDKRFLELCDEIGLYVLDELAGWQKSYDTEEGRRLVGEMVVRDLNHPSILFWDNGNEGGWNTELDGDFALWDPQQRAVLHPWEVHDGINTAHYRVYPQLVSHTQGLTTPWRYTPGEVTQRPAVPLLYMPTEFLHGLFDGGAGAGMEDYWELIRKSPYGAGGFVWSLVDEGLQRWDTGKLDVVGNKAPDGILGPRREKEGSFYTIKELWAPVMIQERRLPDAFVGELNVENRYDFTNLSACRFQWSISHQPMPGEAVSAERILASGEFSGPELVPGDTGKLRLPLPVGWRDADLLRLRALDVRGQEIWTWAWPLPGLERLKQVSEGAGDTPGLVALEKTMEAWIVRAAGSEFHFSLQTGVLSKVLRSGVPVSLGQGPLPVHGQATLESLSAKQVGPDVCLEMQYKGALDRVRWLVRPNGWLECRYSYRAEKAEGVLGLGFDYPATKVKAKTWFGDGPYRVWQNRLRGGVLGLHQVAYNDTVTGYSGFEYPEFKGCFAGVRWLRLDTEEGHITLVLPEEGLYLQVFRPTLPPPALLANTAIPLPEKELCLLHVIPAIGNKFHKPEMLGPQSEIPPLKESYEGSFYLRFDP